MRADPMPVVFDGVSFDRGDGPIIDGLSLTLTERRVGLLGRNGSGKSTLLRLAGALEYATAGTVTIAGIDPREDLKAVRPLVGYLFQNPEAQLVLPTVAEDVALGLTRGRRGQEHEERIAEALAAAGISGLADRFTHRLSGGEQQLVALAGALVRKPRLLLLDEPTTHLDRGFAQRMRSVIGDLDQQAIIASHDLELIGDCERVVVVDEGKVVFDGGAAQAIDRYEELTQWS